ncbi:MAG TPA: DUF1203 domain-containing protein [Gemmatimonadales bacterium]|nr:DUF1203 domain-containing protein [Gemmatimonadales bacterium]
MTTATTTFQVTPLPAEMFAELATLSPAELEARGVRRVVADSKPGFPCRVSLRDAEPGEPLWLLHHVHHDVPGPYRASGPIYVREQAVTATPAPGEIPEMLRHRLLSLRAYDTHGMLLAAEVCDGSELEPVVTRLFADPIVAYVHAHNARPGCFNCRIDRVSVG